MQNQNSGSCRHSRKLFALTLWACISYSHTATGQDYIFHLSDACGPQGSEVEVQVLFDNLGEPIGGWTFGVTHDSTFTTLMGVADGLTTQAINNGSTPDFNQYYYTAYGFSVGVVINFFGLATLDPGTDFELNVATYQLDGTNGATSSSLDYCDCIVTGSGITINTVVVVGGMSIPADTVSGTLEILASGCDSTPFIRGETNGDGLSNIADAVSLLTYLFLSGDLGCLDAGDVNDDGALNIADAVSLLSFLFNSGVAPPVPFPDCGADPTADTLECVTYGGC